MLRGWSNSDTPIDGVVAHLRRFRGLLFVAPALLLMSVASCGDDDAPKQPNSPGTSTPFVDPATTNPIVNQNPSTPMGNTPGAGSG